MQISDKVSSRNAYQMYADGAKCAGCMVCMYRCSFKETGLFQPAAAMLQVIRLVDQADEFQIVFKEGCDACGICVAFCPYGVLYRQKTGKGG